MPPVININFANNSNAADSDQTVMSAPTYTLRFHNKSGSTWTFVCYQPPPGNSDLVLAWFAMPVANGVQVNFSWQQTNDLVWMETGKLAPGVQLTASQVVPAADGNTITLAYADGAFNFANQGPGAPPGQLTIRCDGTIPPNTVSVGIGMAGSPTMVMQASASMAYTFTPVANYWVTAVTETTQGEVMIVEQSAAAQVVFPPNVTAMTATLQANETWSIQQGLGM